MGQYAALLMVLTPLGFVAFWCAVCWIIAQVGWRRLGEFHTRDKPDKYFGMQTGYIGSARYKGCLNIGVSDAGLHLSVLPIFPGHAPLLIPWSAITQVQTRKGRWLEILALTVGTRRDAVEISLQSSYVIAAVREYIDTTQSTLTGPYATYGTQLEQARATIHKGEIE